MQLFGKPVPLNGSFLLKCKQEGVEISKDIIENKMLNDYGEGIKEVDLETLQRMCMETIREIHFKETLKEDPLERMQKEAELNGFSKLTKEDIDKLINEVREERLGEKD